MPSAVGDSQGASDLHYSAAADPAYAKTSAFS